MNSNGRSSKSRRVPQGAPRRVLRGKGDYSEEVTSETNSLRRMEKKIDHLEKQLVGTRISDSKAGSIAGRALGSLVGQGDLGAYAGDKLAKLFGFGDYRVAVKGNSLMAGAAGPSVPKFQGDGKRGVRLTEREFLGNIVSGSLSGGSTVFTNQSFPLNPNSSETFPWLSQVAYLFDQWEPHGIVFEFHTTSSTFNGTSQALGAVIMATDYDSNDPAFSSKQVMENADYACSSVPSSNLLHGIECSPSERPLQVMYCTPRNGQLNFSNLGNFQIATAGCSTAGTTLGELWISYDITFYKKQLVSPAKIIDCFSSYAVGVTSTNPLIPLSSILYAENILATIVVGTGTRLSFPPSKGTGKYVYTCWISAHNTLDGIAPTSLTNCTFAQQLTAGVAPANYAFRGVITLTGPNASFIVGTKNTNTGDIQVTLTEVSTDYTSQ